MTGRSRAVTLTLLPVAAFVFGCLDYGPGARAGGRIPRADRSRGIVARAGIRLVPHRRARARYKASLLLKIAMPALTIVALPYYLLRSRGLAAGVKALARGGSSSSPARWWPIAWGSGLRSVALVALVAPLVTGSAASPRPAAVVQEISRVHPVAVERIVTPTTIDEIVASCPVAPRSRVDRRWRASAWAARRRRSARCSWTCRRFDKVVAFSKEAKEITVQTGITWRKIQEYIDPHDLSLQIMQTYANFTVGGSLCVNVHGRYVGQGPLVMSVRSIRVVLADGTVVDASPAENSPSSSTAAIGGYGALGVIVEATLALADNVRVERKCAVMPVAEYPEYFRRTVRENRTSSFTTPTCIRTRIRHRARRLLREDR